MRGWSRSGIALLVLSGACARGEAPPAPSATVEIVSSDYAFRAPPRVPPGHTTFQFRNEGKERHELNISRLKPGVSIEQMLQKVRADETVQPLIEGPVGVLFAAPGGASAGGLGVDLQPGQRYAVICIFRDSAGAKPHYDLGMYSVITVDSGSSVASPPPAPTDTVVATDYAFQYPRSLTPGRHTFMMRNDGKQRHEMSIILLKKGVTLQKVQEIEKAGGDIDATIEGDFGLVHAPGGRTPFGYLTIDMLPDREYVIGCYFRDNPTAPEHHLLGMIGSIHTTSSPRT